MRLFEKIFKIERKLGSNWWQDEWLEIVGHKDNQQILFELWRQQRFIFSIKVPFRAACHWCCCLSFVSFPIHTFMGSELKLATLKFFTYTCTYYVIFLNYFFDWGLESKAFHATMFMMNFLQVLKNYDFQYRCWNL